MSDAKPHARERDSTHAVTTLDLHLEPGRLRFERENEARIKAYFATQQARNPYIWDGRILLFESWSIAGGVLSGTAHEAAFSTLLAWRDWGFPDAGIANLFGSAAILSADGALVLGRMSHDTVNGGKVTLPGGSLEPSDVLADGRVDIDGSIARELAEETGLTAAEGSIEDGYVVSADCGLISIARLIRFSETAAALAARIDAFLATQARPELDGVVTVRRRADLDGLTVPGYTRMLVEHLFD